MRLWLKKTARMCLSRISKIFSGKDKCDDAELKEAEHKFRALTPIDNVNLGIYESALHFVFASNNIKNIAISGSYGAGKSSVIESYKKKHPDKRFLHISLTRFRPEDNEVDGKESDEKQSTNDTVLEGKILNQLIHQIPAENIPRTNFRVKKDSSKEKNIRTAFLAAMALALGLYAIYFWRWVSFFNTLSVEWIKNVLNFSIYTEIRLIAGIMFMVIGGVFIYRIVKLQENQSIIKKATISGLEIEIFKENNDSYFDKYLNEVLYLFKQVEVDAIVFEDIDRYDSSKIFERLHEVNRLVNNDRKSEPPLRFFFLLKDDIFISKDRTKFFDFIIPIVPVIDGSNSFDKFIECFEKSGIVVDEKNKNKLSTEFLQGISLYIDDMRLLQNICNEFTIYHSRISTTEQDEKKMFALTTYKNLFPRDFSELQLGQGFMFEVIGGRGKERLIASEFERIKKEIKNKTDELERVRAEFLVADELAIIYGQKILGIQSHHRSWTADDYRENMDYAKNRVSTGIFDEYNKRVAHAANSTESKENRIIRIEKEIQNLNNELLSLLERLLRDLLTRENIDVFFKDTIFKSETGDIESYKGIKDGPYFAMLKFLVREGHIDETYSDYMTYFYEKSLKRVDKIFLRSVTDKNAKEAVYKLDDPDLVVSRLPLMYFDQEETLNFSLFNFMLSDFIGNRKYVPKTKRLIKQIRDKELHEFLMVYASSTPIIDNLIKVFGAEWSCFLNDYFIFFDIGQAPAKDESAYDVFVKRFAIELFILVGANSKSVSFIDKETKAVLVEYVSNDANFMHTNTSKIKEVSAGIKQFEVKFVNINTKSANKELLRLIYESSSYVINYENILAMLHEYYSSIELDNISSSGYTIIMSDEESYLAKYINDHINDYLSVILNNCDSVITDSEKNALIIVNNEKIEKEKRITYISYLHTVIVDLRKIESLDLWEELIKNHKALEYTAENIVSYFVDYSGMFDVSLINFINAKGTSIVLDGAFSDEEQKINFFNTAVSATALNNAIYKGYISQFNFCYNEFTNECLSIEKISILDNLKKIGMTSKSLITMRNHYTKYLYTFICNHIEDYIGVVSAKADDTEEEIFNFDEMLLLLDMELSVEHKIALLQLTQKPVSIESRKCHDDKLYAYIINKNYETGDFEYLVCNYETFKLQTKEAILSRAIQGIELLKEYLFKTSRLLITDVLSSKEATLDEKHEIFKVIALKASENEVRKWLNMIDLAVLLDVYDKGKRPKFENTDINAAILEILKQRGDITDYILDENSGKYKIKRSGAFALLD